MTQRSFVILFFAAVAGLIWGCSGAKHAEREFVWPDPPDTPRIKFLTTYQNESQFKSGLGKSLERLSGSSGSLSFARPFDVTGDNHGHIFVTDGVQGIFEIDQNTNDFKMIECKNCRFSLSAPRGIACDTSRIFVGLPRSARSSFSRMTAGFWILSANAVRCRIPSMSFSIP